MRTRKTRPLCCLLLIVATSAGATIPLRAHADRDLIETVVVTARRSEQDAAEVPSSIRSIHRGELEMVSAVHVAEILARAPGAWINRGNGQELLTAIRSPVFTGSGSCGAFFTAEDGIALRPAGFCNVNELAEVNSEQAERIEVLRGPGTAVHGSNAQHGVVNVISRAPGDTGEQSASIEAGPHEYLRFLGSYSNRLGRENAYRVNLNASHDGGYKHDSGYDQQKLNYRHDAAWSGVRLSSLLSLSNLNQETAGFVTGKAAYKDSDRKKENPNPEAYRDNETARWYGRFSYGLGESGTLSLTPYLRYQDMQFLQHFLPGQPVEENGSWSAGWQGAWDASVGDSLRLMTGLDGEWAQAYLKETQYVEIDFRDDLPTGKHYDYEVESLNTAGFALFDWEAGPRTRLSGGLRLERQEYDYDNRMIDGATRADGSSCGSSTEPRPCRYSRPSDRSDSFTEASYNLGLAWQFMSRQELILNYAHGFRPPQAAELYRLQSGQLVADIDSEEIDSFEAGWRGALLRVECELVGYFMSKDDVIFQDSERRNVSGAETEHYGIEYSLAWDLGRGWSLSADGSWAVHRYANDAAPGDAPAGRSIKGNDMDTAPRTVASTRLGWQADADTLLELEWIHVGDYYLEPTESFEYPGHDLLNLRLRQQLSEQFYWAARVTNLSDEDYAERADYAFGSYRYFVGEPRSLYLEVGWRS